MARALASLGRSVLMGACALLLGSSPAAPSWLSPVLAGERARVLSPAIEDALNSRDESVAVRAALAAGRTKQPAAARLLGAHLDDPRAAVRAMCIYAIGLIVDGPRDGSILLAMRDPSSAVRYAALDAADRYAAANAIAAPDWATVADSVGALLANDSDPLVRARAAATLVSFSTASNASALVAALVQAIQSDRAAIVREDAMWSIFRGYASAAPHDFELSMLHDSDEIVRIEALRALGRRKNAGDVAAVQVMESDPSWRVQEQANETLRSLRGEALTQHWTAIPSWVHVPARRPDPWESLAALPRTPASGHPGAPTVDDVIADASLWHATLDPQTAAAMGDPRRVCIRAFGSSRRKGTYT